MIRWHIPPTHAPLPECRHYDSQSTRGSRAAAAKLHRSVQPALCVGGHCPLVHVESMPQQQNGYDCGVYVLMVTDAMCTAANRTWNKTGGYGRVKCALDELHMREGRRDRGVVACAYLLHFFFTTHPT